MDIQTYWPGWAHFLHQYGVRKPAVLLLGTAGPLVWFAAQAIYLGQPFLDGSANGGQWRALAGLLENQEESRSFAAFLREEGTR